MEKHAEIRARNEFIYTIIVWIYCIYMRQAVTFLRQSSLDFYDCKGIVSNIIRLRFVLNAKQYREKTIFTLYGFFPLKI